jgi:hypothetical protein
VQMRHSGGFQFLCESGKETADLSTPLRSGRDDKFVLGRLRFFQSMAALNSSTNLSSRPERSGSGEICGFFSVSTPLGQESSRFLVQSKNRAYWGYKGKADWVRYDRKLDRATSRD